MAIKPEFKPTYPDSFMSAQEILDLKNQLTSSSISYISAIILGFKIATLTCLFFMWRKSVAYDNIKRRNLFLQTQHHTDQNDVGV